MTDRGLVRLARSAVAAGSGLAIAGGALAIGAGHFEYWWRSFAALGTAVAIAFAPFVWVVVPRHPRNLAVWSMVASAGLGFEAAGLGLASVLAGGDPVAMLGPAWVPADSPAAVGWTLVPARAVSVPALFVPLTAGLVLFPDGRLPSRRWRSVIALSILCTAALAVTHGWWHRPGNASTDEGAVLLVAGTGCVLTAALSMAGLLARFRRSEGLARLQYKWIVGGTVVGVAVLGGFFFLPPGAYENGAVVGVGTAAAVLWAISYGAAVGRYRLYDVDLVLSRGFAFACLAAVIGAIYVVVVVGVGSFVAGPDLWLSVVATALVAVAFEPARLRLQRWADRLVRGHRMTPYEVLGDVASRFALAEAPEQLLERLALLLRAGTGARRTAVWLQDGDLLRLVAASAAGGNPSPPSRHAAGGVADLPIQQHGRTVGRLTVEMPAGSALHPAGARLAEDLARVAALIVHKLRLDRELAERAAEIEESRRRLVRAQDDELRRLQDELAREVGLHVAALGAEVEAVRELAASEGARRTGALLGEVADEAADVMEQMRRLAHGLYPPLLDVAGLQAALPWLAGRSPAPPELEISLACRPPAAVEVAVYFCVAEALTNATKHAEGPVRVSILGGDGSLTFSVSDGGPGFDPAAVRHGSGLQNMVDRIDALGGRLEIRSRPDEGTTVSGSVPLVAAGA